MPDQKFHKELRIIEEALKDERGEVIARKYFSDFLKTAVDLYIKKNNTCNIPKEKLVEAAWTYFGVALKKYLGRAYLMLNGNNEVYYFETYFNWYIKQGILEYINSLKNKAVD